MSKLEAPTSLVINSMENIELPGEWICNVNITFNYNGKLEGATYGTLRVSDTNDNSKAQYDSYNSNVKIEKGENTRTASITNFKAVSGKKYYFLHRRPFNYRLYFITFKARFSAFIQCLSFTNSSQFYRQRTCRIFKLDFLLCRAFYNAFIIEKSEKFDYSGKSLNLH